MILVLNQIGHRKIAGGQLTLIGIILIIKIMLYKEKQRHPHESPGLRWADLSRHDKLLAKRFGHLREIRVGPVFMFVVGMASAAGLVLAMIGLLTM